MKISDIDFPEPLLAALRDGKLVVFAGGGISMGEPASLPDFKGLSTAIAQGTGQTLGNQEPDRFLGRLQHKGVNVHERAGEELSRHNPEPTDLHRDLLRLYSEPRSVRIVTTNFDTLLEQAVGDVFESKPEVYQAPALPLGHKFDGIVHVHGAVNRPDDMVLTDADFGRAYLIEGWARRFLVGVFRSFSVLFVGYSHNDTIMNYLARALPESGTGRRFALTDCADHGRWQVLGIAPITYPTRPDNQYHALYKGIHRLAGYVRRGVLDWQREITELAKKSPPLDEEEAGNIDEALRDATKTRFFTDAASSPEWIGWLDGRKHLDDLFGTEELNDRDSQLALWFGEKFRMPAC